MKNNLKHLTLLFLFFSFFPFELFCQNVAVNATGNIPDSSAMLDISSDAKGILIPRVSLTSVTDASTISAPATSLLIYNTNESLSGDNADGAGYYYNAGTPGSPAWVKLSQNGDRWDDLRVSLDKGSNAAYFDYFNGSSGPQIWYFRNNEGVEAMSFTVQLPHGWKEGTTIYPHIHWMPKSTRSGNVEWNLEYAWANYNAVTPELFPAITTATVTASGPFTAKSHVITPLTSSNAGIDGTGKKISSILICRIWRNSSNASDTYNDDAGIMFLDFHILMDGNGSHLPFTK